MRVDIYIVTTDLDEFPFRQRSFLQASVQELDMIAQHLIDRIDISQLGLERAPVRLEDLEADEREHLLNEREHARPKRPDAQFPMLEPGKVELGRDG